MSYLWLAIFTYAPMLLLVKKILSRITRGVKGMVICQCTLASVHDGSLTYG
jgi:hypothetical protein